MKEFKRFLELRFLDWQKESGGRRTVEEFAKYIGVGKSTLSMWWNGERVPQGENIHKLSLIFGLEVYDALGLERPDEGLHYVIRAWPDLPQEERAKFISQLEKAAGRYGKKKTENRNAET